MKADRVDILLVDDQPGKLATYRAILTELGENLIEARSAKEALGTLLNRDMAAILMDVGLPEMDGFELADLIRQHPRFRRTPIIFVTGVHLTDADMVKSFRHGAVDYIPVPVVPEILRAKVGIFIELYRKTRLLEEANEGLEQAVAKRTEELRRSEAAHRQQAEMLELALDGFIVHDFEGTVRYWNKAAEAMYGWRRDEAVGQQLNRLLQSVYPVSEEIVRDTVESSRIWEGNVVQQTRTGQMLVVSVRKVIGPDRKTILATHRDITALHQAEEALRQADKFVTMGRVATMIAHEVNNPLEAIMNTVYLLRNHPSLDAEARAYASLAENEVQRASHIATRTLGFFRESKQPVEVSVPELLDTVIELKQRSLVSGNIIVERRYSSTGAVSVFPGELRQVLLNLIDNAIGAMPQGGVLRLGIRNATDWISRRRGLAVVVVDTGAGIRREDARRLFEPFFTTKGASGTGLGLWVSRGIVQKYEGRLTFRSLHGSPRVVTCFRVFLPRAGEWRDARGADLKSCKEQLSGGSAGIDSPTLQ
ncbi:MAG TPA: ATP-binding protein [Terriglobales bacterium]|nr:ATP-binding protein [Acidobacteriaceae bacterium]HKR30269.1 ATP-binding protein [Terriglobales bacterium]